MRRGLISRSKAELPDAVLDARLARVRAAMDAAGLDALLLYTNNTRAAGVSWLTGFVPYWSEALLVVPRDREPVLVAALSYRVKSWIERTSRLAEVIHGPRIGLEAAKLIAAWRLDAAVGIADLDGLAAGIVEDLRRGGPRLSLSDATALFAPLRAEADPAEIALAMRAAAIAQHALAQTPGRGASLGESIAAVEAQARTDGAEEVYVAAAPDLDRDRRLRRIEGEAALGESFALRATVAYKGTWIRLTRTFPRDGAVHPQEAVARLAAAVAKLPSSDGFAGFSSWLVEGCRIAQPLEPLMGSRVGTVHPLAPGALVSVQADFEIEGRPLLLGAPALVGRRGEAASLLVPPF
ncbi:MAG: aminopeptidase P family N-terminal domain-containing protein [Hyphomicrobiales bacterium]|nr:aminopeptidase P family N-terminal domain-containing protein [Hyphomicrobiales bacterium]